jgi:hypothetical protein
MAGRDYDPTRAIYGLHTSGDISCLNKGPNRENNFPETFVCIVYVAYEDAKHTDPTSRIKRGYTAKHTDIQSPCDMEGIPLTSYKRLPPTAESNMTRARGSRPRSPTN